MKEKRIRRPAEYTESPLCPWAEVQNTGAIWRPELTDPALEIIDSTIIESGTTQTAWEAIL